MFLKIDPKVGPQLENSIAVTVGESGPGGRYEFCPGDCANVLAGLTSILVDDSSGSSLPDEQRHAVANAAYVFACLSREVVRAADNYGYGHDSHPSAAVAHLSGHGEE